MLPLQDATSKVKFCVGLVEFQIHMPTKLALIWNLCYANYGKVWCGAGNIHSDQLYPSWLVPKTVDVQLYIY